LLRSGELPDRGGDFGWRKNGSRNLIEERLEDVVIALVDQNDVCIASLQSASRGNPGKAAAHNHDALSPYVGSAWHSRAFTVSRPGDLRGPRPTILQSVTHWSPSSWHHIGVRRISAAK